MREDLDEFDKAEDGNETDTIETTVSLSVGYETGGRGDKTYKKPSAKIPTRAYRCRRGNFSLESTGIGNRTITISVPIFNAVLSHHRLPG